MVGALAPTPAATAIAALIGEEVATYVAAHPVSQKLSDRAAAVFPDGVPLHWMRDWATPFPMYLASASGNRVIDVDNHTYIDFCLGDSGALFGHAPAPVIWAIAGRVGQGVTAMLPSEDSIAAAEGLGRRFGLPFWQFTTTASDCNRAVLRWARAITGRRKVLVFNGCYHGMVDDTMVRLKDGRTVSRPGLLGQVTDPATTTTVVEFNDLAAVESALAGGDIACVMTEPALTNIGIVQPDPGFHEGLRALTRKYGALLVIDETHTLATSPGGWTAAYGLQPDFLTLGKPIAGGIPCGVYGFTAEMAKGMAAVRANRPEPHGHTGIGTTLSGNALQVRAVRAVVEDVMTDHAYAVMIKTARALVTGINDITRRHALPWHVSQVGARVEFHFTPTPYRNGAEAAAGMRPDLEAYINVALINQGIMITPFHNMLLTCPNTTEADITTFLNAFDLVVSRLSGLV